MAVELLHAPDGPERAKLLAQKIRRLQQPGDRRPSLPGSAKGRTAERSFPIGGEIGS